MVLKKTDIVDSDIKYQKLRTKTKEREMKSEACLGLACFKLLYFFVSFVDLSN